MLKTLESLKHELITSYEILDFKQGKDFYFLKIKAILIDNSELYIREYVSPNEYFYSYHWQDEKGNLRIRWDNSPHHKEIETFPHHKHAPQIEASSEINLDEVLKVIEEKLRLKY